MCCEVVVGEMELRRKVSSLCARTARLSFHLECNALNVNKSDALDKLGTSRIKHGDCNSSTLKERRKERAWSARNTSWCEAGGRVHNRDRTKMKTKDARSRFLGQKEQLTCRLDIGDRLQGSIA